MKKSIILVAFLLLWWACSNTAGPGPEVSAGEKIYRTYCVNCHGLLGNMGGSGAFDLTASALSLEERAEVITNGRNMMVPFKSILSPEKIEEVARYTFELGLKEH